MELFEQIRREYEHGVGTIKGVARKFGVHRRMVRDAIASAVPQSRRAAPRERPKLGPAVGFIDEILQADRKAPRKQRHTARRIWMRLRQEMPEVTVAECTVRQFVHRRKRELGLAGGETFIPQSYRWGTKARWTGMKRGRSWEERSRSYMCFACGRWPVEVRSIEHIRTPANRLSWKRTSWRSSTSAGYSDCCVSTI